MFSKKNMLIAVLCLTSYQLQAFTLQEAIHAICVFIGWVEQTDVAASTDQVEQVEQTEQTESENKTTDHDNNDVETPENKMTHAQYDNCFKNYNSALSIPENIAFELIAARQEGLKRIPVRRKYVYKPIDKETQDILVDKKDTVQKTCKTLVYTGVIQGSPVASFSGPLDVAYIIALEKVSFKSKGLIARSLSKTLTHVDGDFIINTSIFYGTTHIDKDASMVSYNNCVLDEVCIHNKDMILDLRNTLVTGNIVFDHFGTVVLDKKTMLNGRVLNARVVMAEK